MSGGMRSTIGNAKEERLRLLERGLDYLARDNVNFARLVLKECIRKFGEDADSLVHLAMTHARVEEHKKALDLYRKALAVGESEIAELKPVDDLWKHVEARPYLRALHGMGLTLMELGRFDESLRQFRSRCSR